MASRALGRTVNYNNHAFYATDGFGRDGYITYNNGGYYKENLKSMVESPKYPIHKFSTFHSLTRSPPAKIYRSDGTGRDSYVMHKSGGFTNEWSPLNKVPLKNYLRDANTLPQFQKTVYCSQRDYEMNSLLNKIQKQVIDRLYTKEKKKFIPFKLRKRITPLKDFDIIAPTLAKSQSTYNVSNQFINYEAPKKKISFSPALSRMNSFNQKSFMPDCYTKMILKHHSTNDVLHD